MEIQQEDFHDPERPSKKRGRVAGSVNFDKEEDIAMLEIAESLLPLGGFGWDKVNFPMQSLAIIHELHGCRWRRDSIETSTRFRR